MSDIDARARQATDGLRTAVRDVRPRRVSAMRANTPRLLAALATAAILAGTGYGIAAETSGSATSRPATTGPLLPTATKPASITSTRAFAPAGLDITVTVPSKWRSLAPANGFQYVLASTGGPQTFLGASQGVTLGAKTAGQVADDRRRFLEQLGASISSISTGAIAGHAAVRLHYRFPGRSNFVDDVEYDILVKQQEGNTTVNAVATMVLGQAVGGSDGPLLDWIASTMRIR